MKATFTGIGGILVILAIFFLAVAFTGWLVMLAIGILAGSGVVPSTMAFGDSIWLGLIVSTLLASSKVNNN
jgi:hypothetical protein